MNEDLARRRLEEEHTRLVVARSALTERLADDEARLAPLDRSDSAPDLDQLELALAVGAMIDADLVAVDAALGRLDAGTYGTCAACGSRIADERLDAIPSTALCVHHEGRAELDLVELPGRSDGRPTAGAPLLRIESPRGNGALAASDLDGDGDDVAVEDAAVHVQVMD